MNNFYDWDPQYSSVVIAIISVSLGFATYWFISISEKIKSQFFKSENGENSWVRYVFFQKMMGVLFMGVVPGFIVLSTSEITLSELGLNFNHFTESLIYIGIMGSIILTLNFFVSKNPANLSMYPQMRLKEWSKNRVMVNAMAWAAYLFAYEFMYRGMLLIICYHSFGFWPAVAINLSFYSATHIAKGLGETIGTFPYGLLLCFVTISTGSLVVAFITHLMLAMSNDYYAVHHNPEMKFV